MKTPMFTCRKYSSENKYDKCFVNNKKNQTQKSLLKLLAFSPDDTEAYCPHKAVDCLVDLVSS